MINKALSSILLFFFSLMIVSCSGVNSANDAKVYDSIWQLSTITALYAGDYDGREELGAVMGNGDFGLGTFHKLDGEMVVVSDTAYQVSYSGDIGVPNLSTTVPFVSVTSFQADTSFALADITSLPEVMEAVKQNMHQNAMAAAVKITGSFTGVSTRSVPAQEKPYPPLVDVIQEQAVFILGDVTGSIVGFYFNESFADIHTDGFHFHFITGDRREGGHLLNCALQNAVVEIDYKNQVIVSD